MAAGVLMGAYESTRFKNKPPKAHLESLAVLGAGAGAEEAIKRAAALTRGNILARCGPGSRAFIWTVSGLRSRGKRAAKLCAGVGAATAMLNERWRPARGKLLARCGLGVMEWCVMLQPCASPAALKGRHRA